MLFCVVLEVVDWGWIDEAERDVVYVVYRRPCACNVAACCSVSREGLLVVLDETQQVVGSAYQTPDVSSHDRYSK